jgi:hypothetical protein
MGKYFIAMTIALFLACPLPSQAAEIYFGATAAEVGVGDTFGLGVFLGSAGEAVNAFEGRVVLPTQAVELVGINDGNSIVNFWIERPHEVEGAVTFSGLTPGSFSGDRGLLFTLELRAKAAGPAAFASSDERILLHDGEGTPTQVFRSPLTVEVTESEAEAAPLQPEDIDSPEAFTPSIVQDPGLFAGHWVLLFATQDKGSGLAYFEVKESRVLGLGRWHAAQSPYELLDQDLHSRIQVRAVDRAGNSRLVELPPERPLPPLRSPVLWSILGVGILALTFAITKRFGLWRKP